MEGITVEFNQLRKLVHRLKNQCDHEEDDVKSQFTDFLEVRGAAAIIRNTLHKDKCLIKISHTWNFKLFSLTLDWFS